MERYTNKRKIGSEYEKAAVAYLEANGYQILVCNFRCRLGEIDIIARDGEYICFIEVKYRSSVACGSAIGAVTYAKQKTIICVARYYLMKQGLDEWTPCRFDVVAIDGSEVTLYRNAFQIG